jgi:ribosomal protein S18 acetylase RimI-like enzyme
VDDVAPFRAQPHPGIGPLTTPMRRFALARLQALLSVPAAPTRGFVAWLDETPVGAVELFVGSEAAGLHDLSVVEAYQGRGIGSALVDHVCAAAYDAGRDVVVLLATPDGQRVYLRRGFVEAARFGYYYRSFLAGDRAPHARSRAAL